MSDLVLSCRKVSKAYQEGKLNTPILHDINFDVQASEMVAIEGKSGSGKSTLLHILGGLDQPSRGEVNVMGQDIVKLSPDARGAIRNQHLGFVYQFHHLLPEFTALENVMMPLLIRGGKRQAIIKQAMVLLTQVGLKSRLHHKPSALSGGERQRAAVARALVTQPACVLADEPTGNLDSHTAEMMFSLIKDMNQMLGTSFVIVTHDHELAKKVDRIVRIEDGKLS